MVVVLLELGKVLDSHMWIRTPPGKTSEVVVLLVLEQSGSLEILHGQ